MKVAREIIFIPIILLLLIYLIYNAYGFIIGPIASVFLPTSNSLNQVVKVFTTSMILLVTLEYFIYSNIPNNFFYSRMLGMMFMVSLYVIWETYFNIDFIEYMFIVLLGCFISYITQKTKVIKYQNMYALIILVSVILYIFVFL